MDDKERSMDNNTVRIIKIDREALYEFIYETFISQQEDLLDVKATEVMDYFDIDWATGSFVFVAQKAEDDEGNITPLPEDIRIGEIMKKHPITTDSVLSPGRKYREYTFEELKALEKGN